MSIARGLMCAVVIGGFALLRPNVIEAQGGVSCQTCDNFTGMLGVYDDHPDDRCYQGIDWDEGKLFCASWGSLWCGPEVLSRAAPDGTLPGLALLATSQSDADQGKSRNERWVRSDVRDCRGWIVARSYGREEAAELRRSTQLIRI